MANGIESHPTLPHSYPTIMAWLNSVQDTFCDQSGFWAKNGHQQAQHGAALPVGFFRRNPEQLFHGLEVHKKFLSSGTSGARRAVAMFSKQGLELYKCGALATFNSVLKHYWNNTSAVGLSLIAKASDVPNSSLAAMISWFAEAGDIVYTTAQTCRADVLRQRQRLYVWGTVANYLQLFRCYDSLPLPADSIVFETGGIKAGGAHLELEELHQRLAQFFQLKPMQIVSEYGMCEMASQAYRFGGVAEFRFPVWVEPFVQVDYPAQPTGTGTLVLYDHLRIDYPYLFCTEDRALLSAGRFKLLGRINNAPLRGCSLDYGLRPMTYLLQGEVSPCPPSWIMGMPTLVNKRVARLRPALLDFLRNQAEASLVKELGNTKLAALACSDILASLPECDDWQQVLLRSLPQPELRRWLYILPASHSLVGIYPLCLGYCLGLAMAVKLTEQRRLPLLEDVIALLNSLSPAAQINVHRSRTTVAKVDAVLCYGSDMTIIKLQNTYPALPFAGFGTHDAAIVITAEELHDLRAEISKDVCALGQRGCFAAKVLFCVGNRVDMAAVAALQASLSAYDLPALPAVERQRYEEMGARFITTTPSNGGRAGKLACDVRPECRWVWRSRTPFQCALLTLTAAIDYEQLLPRTGGVLPLVLVKDKGILVEFLQQQQTLKTVACSDSQYFAGRGRVMVGKANAQVWDGLHEGRPLFAARKLADQ